MSLLTKIVNKLILKERFTNHKHSPKHRKINRSLKKKNGSILVIWSKRGKPWKHKLKQTKSCLHTCCRWFLALQLEWRFRFKKGYKQLFKSIWGSQFNVIWIQKINKKYRFSRFTCFTWYWMGHYWLKVTPLSAVVLVKWFWSRFLTDLFQQWVA